MAEPSAPPANPGGSAASSVSRFLNVRQFGMPRWVFLALLAASVGLGLYLRNRSIAAEAEAPEEDMEYDPYAEEGEPSIYDDSLAGAGILPGGGSGSVVPVSAPYLPEGFADILGGVADIFAVIGENPDAFTPDTPGDGDNPTGGGPPARPNRVLAPKAAQRLKGPFERGEYRQLRRFTKARDDQDANVLTPWEWRQLTKGLDRKEKRKLRQQVVVTQTPTPTPTP